MTTTTRTILRALRDEARDWWAYRGLREAGQIAEARRREHESVRRTVEHLRTAIEAGGYVSIGRGGWSLHVTDGLSVHGYGADTSGTVEAARRLGLPILDTRTVPDENLGALVALPMIGIGRSDPEPWGSFSLAPFEEVAAKSVALGATLERSA